MEFLTDTVRSIAGEIAQYTVAPIGQHIGYLVFYNDNINNLRTKRQKLHHEKNGVDRRVDHAKSNLQDPYPKVITWQKGVDDVNRDATEFPEDEETERNKKCFYDLCRNTKSLHSLSRKATKMCQRVDALLEEAREFKDKDFTCPRPPPPLGSRLNTEGVKDFDSRKSLIENVLKALMDDNFSMVSICGLGGVGKTTMVKELVKVVESQKLFDEVAMSVVSQNANVEKIQGDIAFDLGLKLDENTEKGRANKLHKRIFTCEKSILLILDDVWKEINFEEIGISAADKRKKCKIVLTSRRVGVCNNMGSQKNFHIHALLNDEGWDLFKGITFESDGIYNQDMHQMAKQIAAECGGLPIAIIAIAKGLKKRDKSVWSDALNQLKNCNPKGVSGMGDVHSRLEISYRLLECEEAKSLFLLCCLFPEEYDIRVEDLVRYGMGLRLLENVNNIQQARDRVQKLVDELKDSFLLLGSDNYYTGKHVKMHDVFRDMAISIASKEKSYIVSCNDEMKKWPESKTDRYENCRAISLQCKQMKEHPSNLKCPMLELVRLKYGGGSKMLPDNFFNEMRELKVLDLDIPSLPDSLPFLEKLRTLYVSDLAKIGDVRNVEILTITDKSSPMIPKEVGSMRKLRLLDLRGVSKLQYIPRGLLSRLSDLEELYAGDFMQWESTVRYPSDSIRGQVNGSLDELQSSMPLTSLQISVREPSMLPKESVLANLARFRIDMRGHHKKSNMYTHIGRIYQRDTFEIDSIDSENGLRLEGDASEIRRSGICVLLKKTENLVLSNVGNLTSVWHELGNDDFTRLKRISVVGCGKLQNLVDISISSQLPCFSNLREIRIEECDNLNFLFPVAMARRLSRLCSIYVYGCKRMEGVFHGKEEDAEVEFPNLIKLELRYLPELKGLWVNMDNAATKISSTSSFLSHWIRGSNLQQVVIYRCGLLKVAFSSSVVEQLSQLETLEIRECQQMEYIVGSIGGGEEDTRTSRSVFPMLTSIQIIYCPKLKTLFAQTQSPSTSNQTVSLMEEVIPNESQNQSKSSHSSRNWYLGSTSIFFCSSSNRLSNLQKLVLEGCHSVKAIFSASVAEQLLHLQTLAIGKCAELEYIVATDLPGEGEEKKQTKTSRLVFPMLTTIYLSNLPQLVTFCADTNVFLDWHSLKIIRVSKCPKMKTLIEANQNTSTILTQNHVSTNEVIPNESQTRGESSHSSRNWHLGWTSKFFCSSSIRLSILYELVLNNCHSVKAIFSTSVAEQLLHLQTLAIEFCKEVEYIVATDLPEEEKHTKTSRLVFPMLTTVYLLYLPQLVTFCADTNVFLDRHSLKQITVLNCPKMKTPIEANQSTSTLCQSHVTINEG